MKKLTINAIIIASFTISGLNASFKNKISRRDKDTTATSFRRREVDTSKLREISKLNSETKINEEIRKYFVLGIDTDDEETIRNYEELAKMIYVKNIDSMELLINLYDCPDYAEINIDEYSDSDQFFSRILYPCKRRNSEYSNWITNIQLNPKAQWILAKASICLSSWKDLLYILKVTRPGISELQLKGLEKREYSFKDPMPLLVKDSKPNNLLIWLGQANCVGFYFSVRTVTINLGFFSNGWLSVCETKKPRTVVG
jgi:hypothetical protein